MSTIAPVDFGGGGELIRVEHAEPRMAPAQQRLEPGDGSILQPHDRPEQNRDLAALERPAQLVLERLPVRSLRAHVVSENLDPVAAGLLGVGERDLGVGEKIGALGVRFGS